MADEITGTSYEEIVAQTEPSPDPNEMVCRVELKLGPLEAGILLCPDLGRAIAMKRLGVSPTSPSSVILIQTIVDRVAGVVDLFWEKVQ